MLHAASRHRRSDHRYTTAHSDHATARYPTTINPAELEGSFAFLAQLHLPVGVLLADDDQTPVTYLATPDGSWCEVTRQADTDGQHTVREAGPSPLWAAVETAWREWASLGAPACHEFGLTITAAKHLIWHRDPGSGPSRPGVFPGWLTGACLS